MEHHSSHIEWDHSMDEAAASASTNIISPREKRKLETVFQIRAMFITRAKKEAEETIVPSDVVSSMLLKLDVQDLGIHSYMRRYYTDINDGLTYSKFNHFMRSILSALRGFSAADKNDDSMISREEIKSVLKHFEICLEEHSINLLLKIFDTNSDRNLSFGEFVMLYVFLNELKKVFKQFQETHSIQVHQLCRLLDNHDKEFVVAQDLKKIFLEYAIPLTIDNFARIIIYHKEKIRPLRERARPPRHVHPEICRLHIRQCTDQFEVLVPEKLHGKVKWLRMNEINEDSKLFVDGVAPSDVIQGKLQDCWLLGALAVIAAGAPNSIWSLFDAADFEKGYYRIKFFKSGEKRLIEVDDKLACYIIDPEFGQATKRGPLLYYASCLNKTEFWVPIIEKAYAKLHGCYSAIENGEISEALKDLTGGAIQTYDISNDRGKFKELWRLIHGFAKDGCLMGCAIDPYASRDAKSIIMQNKDSTDAHGLLVDHAYSILKCHEEDGVKFVLLRNPWGKMEWNGDWSDTSTKWTDDWKKKPFMKDYPFEDDGNFHMCFEDFVKYFNRLYVLRTRFGPPLHIEQGEWKGSNAVGSHDNPYWYCNPRYAITPLDVDTTVIVNLTQYDNRSVHGLNRLQAKERGSYDHIGMYLLHKEDKNYRSMQYHHVEVQPIFTDSRDTSLQYTFKTIEPKILMPCTLNPDVHSTYTITVYSDKGVNFEQIKYGKPHKAEGKWDAGFNRLESFGRRKKFNDHNTIINGEKFVFTSTKDGNIDILLVPQSKTQQKLTLGLKVYEITMDKEGFPLILTQNFNGPSMCVSFESRKDTKYIVDPITYTTTDEVTPYKLFVFSDFIKKLHGWVSHHHDEGECNTVTH